MKSQKLGLRLLVVAVAFQVAVAALAGSVNGSNYGNVTIPDATASGPGGWVSSTITISGVPAGAVVTGIDAYFKCVHTYSGDLVVDVNADSTGALGNYHLWNREGGAADNPTRTVTGISTFNGLSPNRTWYLYARDYSQGDTGYIDEWTITVYYASPPAAPTLNSPGSLSSPGPTISTLTPTMSWNAVSGATGYGVYVYDVTTSTLVYDNDTVGNVTSVAVGPLTAGHSYRWNARASNAAGFSGYSSLLYFQTQVNVPDAPTLVSPGSSSSPGPSISTLTPTLSWNSASGATGYGVYVYDVTTSTLVYDNDAVGNVTSLTLSSGTLVADHSYRWNARASNAGGFSGYSSLLYFQTQVGAPDAPTLVSPGSASSPGPTSSTLTPTMSWNAVGGATGYGVYVYDITASTLVYDNDSVGNVTSVTLPSGTLTASHSYRWNARASNAGGFSSYSGLLYFQTQAGNQAPTHGIASQVRADSGAVIADPGGTIPQGVNVYFRVTPTDPDGDTVRMEVELHMLPATFTGVATHVSPYVASGLVATTATATGLGAGSYGWRYRAVDSQGAAGAWVSENHPDFIVQGSGPSITGLNPNPVTGANVPQPFYINGANFVVGCNVILRDLTAGGAPFANRPISAISSTQIRIDPNFTTAAHSWSVEVINPNGASSGQYGFNVVAPASCAYTDDYPYPTANIYNSGNPSDPTTIDPWNFYNRECTSYVAWKLNKAAGTTREPWFLYNGMRSGHFGDAGNWAANATSIGFLVNNVPSIGAVAHWGFGELGAAGHVAYVEAVNSDGTVNVSEYNYHLDHNFDVRCNVSPMRFIHVRDVAGGGGGGSSAPVVSSPKVDGSSVTVCAPSEAGVNYVLECKASLAEALWTAVATNSGTGGLITLTNSGASGQARIYRLRLQ